MALRGWCGGAAAAQQLLHLCVIKPIHEKGLVLWWLGRSQVYSPISMFLVCDAC